MNKKLCIVVSSHFTIRAFMLNHIRYLSQYYEVVVICDEHINFQREYDLCAYSRKIIISRKISFLRDLYTLIQMAIFFRKEKFDVVLSVTPKAGFIAMISAYILGIEKRVHFFTGQVWATKKGFFRFLLKKTDKIIVFCSSQILIDSASQRHFMRDERILGKRQGFLLNKGSIAGVDLGKFKSDALSRSRLRQKYGLKGKIVFIFLGRLNKDKGVYELIRSFEIISCKYNEARLLLVGVDEEDIVKKIPQITSREDILWLGYVDNPQIILNAADIFILPSHREGFGTSVLEAAALKIPAIGSNIYGLNDAIIDNVTGMLHQVEDIDSLVTKMEQCIVEPKMLRELGENAFKRVVQDFDSNILSASLVDFILKC